MVRNIFVLSKLLQIFKYRQFPRNPNVYSIEIRIMRNLQIFEELKPSIAGFELLRPTYDPKQAMSIRPLSSVPIVEYFSQIRTKLNEGAANASSLQCTRNWKLIADEKYRWAYPCASSFAQRGSVL